MSLPFGFTEPLSVAVVASKLAAESVLTVGLPAAVAVVNVSSAPLAVPYALVATSRNT